MPDNDMEKIVSLCKRRGIILPGSDIYGGLANSWDFGPLGVELRNNIKKLWWKKFVQERSDMVGLESPIIMNTKVWEATGHLGGFNDWLVECKSCHQRFRFDQLPGVTVESTEDVVPNQVGKGVKWKIEGDAKCLSCGKSLIDNLTDPEPFNLMFRTNLGPVADNPVYLRPETAQGMFVDFRLLQQSSRKKIPFGVAQIGKAFRNEITPGNFIFRTREFEQMEIEYFIKESDWETSFESWLGEMKNWLKLIGVKPENLVYHEIEEADRAFYSKRTIDVEYQYPFGQKELYGLAYRTDYDIKKHMELSGQDLQYFDEETKEKFIPHVIEPSFGLDRTFLVVLLEAFKEYPEGRGGDNSEIRMTNDESNSKEEKPKAESQKLEPEIVLHLPYQLAPIKVAILPLMKKDGLAEKGREIYDSLKSDFMCEYDESGSIGKRYRRNDEVGTPYCITIDYQTLEDDTVTLRDRDSMEQIRVKIDDLNNKIQETINK